MILIAAAVHQFLMGEQPYPEFDELMFDGESVVIDPFRWSCDVQSIRGCCIDAPPPPSPAGEAAPLAAASGLPMATVVAALGFFGSGPAPSLVTPVQDTTRISTTACECVGANKTCRSAGSLTHVDGAAEFEWARDSDADDEPVRASVAVSPKVCLLRSAATDTEAEAALAREAKARVDAHRTALAASSWSTAACRAEPGQPLDEAAAARESKGIAERNTDAACGVATALASMTLVTFESCGSGQLLGAPLRVERSSASESSSWGVESTNGSAVAAPTSYPRTGEDWMWSREQRCVSLRGEQLDDSSSEFASVDEQLASEPEQGSSNGGGGYESDIEPAYADDDATAYRAQEDEIDSLLAHGGASAYPPDADKDAQVPLLLVSDDSEGAHDASTDVAACSSTALSLLRAKSLLNDMHLPLDADDEAFFADAVNKFKPITARLTLHETMAVSHPSLPLFSSVAAAAPMSDAKHRFGSVWPLPTECSSGGGWVML